MVPILKKKTQKPTDYPSHVNGRDADNAKAITTVNVSLAKMEEISLKCKN